jgi:hypothetical protein
LCGGVFRAVARYRLLAHCSITAKAALQPRLHDLSYVLHVPQVPQVAGQLTRRLSLLEVRKFCTGLERCAGPRHSMLRCSGVHMHVLAV